MRPSSVEVEKPARYLGGEYQSVTKDWAAVDVRVAWRSPTSTTSGCPTSAPRSSTRCSTSTRASPASARSRRGSTWRRELRARNLPLVSLESARPLSRLRRGRLLAAVRADLHERADAARPRRHPAARRRSRRDDPLVIGGGPTATHPEPVAPFFDALPHRRGRGGAARAAARVDAREEARGRAAARAPDPPGERAAASTCPRSTTTRVDARTGSRSSTAPIDPRVPRTRRSRAGCATSTSSRSRRTRRCRTPRPSSIASSVEIARGCTEGCRFCQAGMIYRPVRERDPESIVEVGRRRRQERRLRRDLAHRAVDGGRLVHHAARQEGDGRAARRSRSRCRSRRCAPTASTRSCSTRCRACAPPA